MSITQFRTDQGIHWDGVKFVKNFTIAHNLTPSTKPGGFGDSITPEACNKMINNFITVTIEGFFKENPSATLPEFVDFLKKEHIAVEFGKEALLRILTQEGCEGIRFAFCKNHDDENSIIALGIEIDSASPVNSQLIKNGVFTRTSRPAAAEDDPMAEEKGHGITLFDYINASTSVTPQDLYNISRPARIDPGFENAVLKVTENFFGLSTKWE